MDGLRNHAPLAACERRFSIAQWISRHEPGFFGPRWATKGRKRKKRRPKARRPFVQSLGARYDEGVVFIHAPLLFRRAPPLAAFYAFHAFQTRHPPCPKRTSSPRPACSPKSPRPPRRDPKS